MSILIKKAFSLLLLLTYLYLSVFSINIMIDHSHGEMMDCPYMIGQSGLCAMNTFEHLTAWKSLVLTIPSIIYILTLVVFIFAFQYLLSLSPPLLRQFSYYRKIKFEPFISKLEVAFFDGILNPKPY